MLRRVLDYVETRFARFYAAAKPALYTAAFTFGALFLTTITGWLGDLQSAIDAWSNGDVFILPDPSVLSKGLFSAAGAAVSGLLNFTVRYVQGLTGWGETPTY